MKKAVVCIISISGVLLLIILCFFLSTPNVDYIYEYDGKAYVQNSRSFLKKKIELQGYDNINNIVVADDGWYCCAKKGDDNCFLYVTKDNDISLLIQEESNYYSYLSNPVICNGLYQMDYTYQNTEYDDPVTGLIKVDFVNQKLVYDEKISEFLAYSYLSDGESLWGSNGDKILKYEDNNYTEITDGNSVVGINENFLLFERNGELYKLDLLTYKTELFETDINLYDFRTVDFESFDFTDDYFIGCKAGALKLSESNSWITHTCIYDLHCKKKFIAFGSVGKLMDNIQIISNRNEYQAFDTIKLLFFN